MKEIGRLAPRSGKEMVSLGKVTPSALCLAVGFLFCSPPNADAQQVFGSIFGTVYDVNGGVITNATVTITDLSKAKDVPVHYRWFR
jgi:hypothetical protein